VSLKQTGFTIARRYITLGVLALLHARGSVRQCLRSFLSTPSASRSMLRSRSRPSSGAGRGGREHPADAGAAGRAQDGVEVAAMDGIVLAVALLLAIVVLVVLIWYTS
jgi:hypothetical protein